MTTSTGIRRRCGCRDRVTGRQLGTGCPRLANPGHGGWTYVVELPAGPDGSRRQLRRGGFRSQALAEAARDSTRRRLAAGEIADDQQTLAEYLDRWLAGKLALRPTTRGSYTRHMEKVWKPRLGNMRVEAVRPHHVAAAVADLLNASRGGRPVTPAAVLRVVATLRSALGAAVRIRRLPYNPASHVELPKTGRPKAVERTAARTSAFWADCQRLAGTNNTAGRPPRVTFDTWRAAPGPAVAIWAAAQLGQFLDHAATDRLGALYELAAMTGLRRGEACGLRWADLDLDRGLLVVREQRVPLGYAVVAGPPKTSRYSPIPAAL